MEAVWSRVAAGELAVTHDVGTSLRQPLGGAMTLGNGRGVVEIRVGAFASMTPRIDAVVNARRGQQLGMLPDNAMLVSANTVGNAAVATAVKRMAGKHVTIEDLAAEPPSEGEQTAVLTGGSVAGALGSFRYRYFEDGTVEPDPAWVGANIRSATLPILGNVTCHRVLLPQLGAALAEVEDTGLASSIDAGDFGGCYVPRFIGRDPGKGLSLHTWGIALDLNVAGNQRGTVGEIDLGVVAIFRSGVSPGVGTGSTPTPCISSSRPWSSHAKIAVQGWGGRDGRPRTDEQVPHVARTDQVRGHDRVHGCGARARGEGWPMG